MYFLVSAIYFLAAIILYYFLHKSLAIVLAVLSVLIFLFAFDSPYRKKIIKKFRLWFP